MTEIRAREFFIRRLYAKGHLSIRDCYKAMEPKIARVYGETDPEMKEAYLSHEVAQVVYELSASPGRVALAAGVEPIVVPGPMTDEQTKILGEWETAGANDKWDMTYNEGPHAILDSIEWKFGAGWRNRYPDIP